MGPTGHGQVTGSTGSHGPQLIPSYCEHLPLSLAVYIVVLSIQLNTILHSIQDFDTACLQSNKLVATACFRPLSSCFNCKSRTRRPHGSTKTSLSLKIASFRPSNFFSPDTSHTHPRFRLCLTARQLHCQATKTSYSLGELLADTLAPPQVDQNVVRASFRL